MGADPVKWIDAPEPHDFLGADSYLSRLCTSGVAASLVREFKAAEQTHACGIFISFQNETREDMTDKIAPGRLVIHASSGHARVVADVALACGFELVAFVDSYARDANLHGIPIYRTPAEAASLGEWYFVAIGDNAVRARVVEQVESELSGICFATLVHPNASVSRYSAVGQGSVLMPNAVVNAGCNVGAHVILNTAAVLEHDSTVADFSSLAPHAVTGSHVMLGRYSAVSIGAIVRQGIRIGNDVVIGAAAYVNADVPDNVIAYGTPARVIRHRNHGDRYF
jgi:sugar O-acyltransferase (sialic acid O-acetyltransferase NeuD family)